MAIKSFRIWNPKSGGEYQDRPCDPYYWDKVMEMRDFNEKIIDVNTHTMRNKFPRFLMNECNLEIVQYIHSENMPDIESCETMVSMQLVKR